MLTNKTALCDALHPVYCARSGCTDWCKLHTALASLCSRPCCAYRHTPALISPHTPCFHIKRLPLITSSNIAQQIVTLIKLLLLIIWKCGVKYPGKSSFRTDDITKDIAYIIVTCSDLIVFSLPCCNSFCCLF